MVVVNIHLKRGNNEILLPIIPYETKLWRKWLIEIKRCIEIHWWEIREKDNDRVYNLSEKLSEDEYVKKFNLIIRRINIPQQSLDEITIPLSQELMNTLHNKYVEFTQKRRQYEMQWVFWADVILAYHDLNILIHRWESRNGSERIVVYPEWKQKKKLSEEDLQEFTYQWKKWEVLFDYCVPWKTILNAYYDHESVEWNTDIRPQDLYSASCMILFRESPFCNIEERRRFKLWWKDNVRALNDLGIVYWDPKAAVWYGPVWMLKNDPDTEKQRIMWCEKIVGVSLW